MTAIRSAIHPATILALGAAAAGAAEPYAGTPWDGKPHPVPGVLLATQYDAAPGLADGIAWHYRGTAKAGGGRPAADAIGIGDIGADHVFTGGGKLDGGHYLGWTHDGEWTRYTVAVAAAGTYVVGGRFASAGTQSRMTLASSAGASVSWAVPTTAGFQPAVEVYHVWGDHAALGEIALPAGIQVLTLTLDRADGLNVERITLTRKP